MGFAGRSFSDPRDHAFGCLLFSVGLMSGFDVEGELQVDGLHL
jgi:hypothetical protein